MVIVEPSLGRRVLALLAGHESLTYEQVAAQLDEPTNEVRGALSRLRGIGLVEAVALGELEAHVMGCVASWRITSQGRAEAERLGSR